MTSALSQTKEILGAGLVLAFVLVVGVVGYGLFLESPSPSGMESAPLRASDFTSLVDNQNEVTVSVTPKVISSDGIRFDVTLDNHRISLEEDLTQVSVLEDGRGKTYAALGWEGSPPGGHHRSGILLFPIVEDARMLTLRLRGVGGAAERVFVWGAGS
ncbi:MAG: hypothetical protein Q8P05_04185 [Candidatus Diapherotrites archaeon]|nr:hypothetical protein [Candidatus Diapherotrites archaeon]